MASALNERVHKKTLLLLLAFSVLFDFTGCSSFSAQARRERAYRHYVAKQMKKRQKQITRAQKAANRRMGSKLKFLHPSDPQVTTSVENSAPASVSQSAPGPSGSYYEQVAPPVTVSASDAIATQNPGQQSPP